MAWNQGVFYTMEYRQPFFKKRMKVIFFNMMPSTWNNLAVSLSALHCPKKEACNSKTSFAFFDG